MLLSSMWKRVYDRCGIEGIVCSSRAPIVRVLPGAIFSLLQQSIKSESEGSNKFTIPEPFSIVVNKYKQLARMRQGLASHTSRISHYQALPGLDRSTHQAHFTPTPMPHVANVTSSYNMLPSPRQSMASSQKLTVRTQADCNAQSFSQSSRMIQSQRGGMFQMANMSRQFILPSTQSRNLVVQETTRVDRISTNVTHSFRAPQMIDFPRQELHHPILTQNRSVTQIPIQRISHNPAPVERTFPAASQGVELAYRPSPVIAHELVVHNNIHTSGNGHLEYQYLNPGSRMPRVTRIEQPLVGRVSVQNIPLQPRMRKPQKRAGRFFKSAVQVRAHKSPNTYYLDRRPRSVGASRGKAFKGQTYIRGHYKTYISDKKIPVVGSYYSNDKSKVYVMRQMSSRARNPSISRVVGVREAEIIPTQVIKIAIGQAQELRTSLAQSWVPSENVGRDHRSDRVLPQTNVQYSSANNLTNSRLSDHLTISVYKSPEVVVASPQLITSGPKLSKQHVLRVAGEVRSATVGGSHQTELKTEATVSKNLMFNINQTERDSNPLIEQDFILAETAQCLTAEIVNPEINYSYGLQNNACLKSRSEVTSVQTSSLQRSWEIVSSRVTPLHNWQSSVCTSSRNFEAMMSSYHFQRVQKVVEKEQPVNR